MAKHDAELDTIFRALGDPTRRALLQRLSQGPATVSDLARPHAMALPTLMAHLRRLEAAGLVTSSKSGRTRTYALVPAAFDPADSWLATRKTEWESRLDRFDAYVATRLKENPDGS